MGAQLIVNRQTPSATWAASTVVSMDIKATGALTRLVLRFHMTASGSMVATNQEQGIYRIAQTLKLVGNGGVNYFSMGDMQISRMLRALNQNDRVAPGITQPLATTNDTLLVIHFGSRPFDQYGRSNPFDLSAFVPAMDDSGLKLEWGTTANDVMDDAITISSGTLYATLYEALGTKGDILGEIHRQGVRQPMVPSSSYYSYAHTGTFSDVSKELDLPAGAFLRRVAILCQDDTATRPLLADDEVTEVALKLPVGNQRLFFDDWPAMVQGQQAGPQNLLVDDTGVTGGAVSLGAGFAVLDCRQLAHPDYGLDLRGYTAGAVKLGVTIGSYAAGDDSFYWFDQVRPYKL